MKNNAQDLRIMINLFENINKSLLKEVLPKSVSQLDDVFKSLKFNKQISNIFKKIGLTSSKELESLLANNFDSFKNNSDEIINLAVDVKKSLAGSIEVHMLKHVNTPQQYIEVFAKKLASSSAFNDNYKTFNTYEDLSKELVRKGYSQKAAHKLSEVYFRNKSAWGDMLQRNKNVVDDSKLAKQVNPATKQKITNAVTKGWSWQKIVATFGALASIPTIWSIVKGTGTPPKDTPPQPPNSNEFLPCIQELINKGQLKINTDNSGVQYAFGAIKGVEVYVYKDGKIKDKSSSRTGKVICNQLRENKKLTLINVLFEATTNNEIPDLHKNVGNAISLLDGNVETENLKELKGIIQSLIGKTYKGKDAIDQFLYYYKSNENEDFIDEVKGVGVRWLSSEAQEIKDDIINLVQNRTSSVPNPQTTTTDGKYDTNLVWDDGPGGGTPPPPKPKPQKIQYHNCSQKDFPFEYGCISPRIAEIQRCKGIQPAKGYFGPITRRELGFKVITRDMYDDIMANCRKTPTEPSKYEPAYTAKNLKFNNDSMGYINKEIDKINRSGN